MKKGFTLIELLAVIVILAIIALIATPIVLNIINDTKESALLRSADFYIDGVETSVATSILKGITINDGIYSIMQDGSVCIGTYNKENDTCTGDKLEVEMDGEVPKKGTITITSGQISNISLNLSDKTIIKNNKGELVYLKKINDICKPVKEQLYATNPLEEGYKYECEVKTGAKYNFYVLSKEEDGTINLIMDRNINSDGTPTTKEIKESEKNSNGGIYNLVEWINKTDYELAGGQSWYSNSDNNNFGPITAMNFLYNATKDWTNIPNMVMDYDDTAYITQYGVVEGYGGIKTTNGLTQITKSDGTVTATYENLKTRLPYFREVTDLGCIEGESGSCSAWLFNLLEVYWISASDFHHHAYIMATNGYLFSDFVDGGRSVGVRPVINLQI